MTYFDNKNEKPPVNFKGWKKSDYDSDPRASEVRLLCIDAIKVLILHQSSASQRDELGARFEQLQGRFIALNIFPGMHSDKHIYCTTESARMMAECRASELSKYCGIGMPSAQVAAINLANEDIIDNAEGNLVAVGRPSAELAEFCASQMYLTICAEQLDAEREIYGI